MAMHFSTTLKSNLAAQSWGGHSVHGSSSSSAPNRGIWRHQG